MYKSIKGSTLERKIKFKMADTFYVQYYQVQAGAGLEHIGPTYYRSRFLQSGRGFGNIFSSLIKWFQPIASRLWPSVRSTLANAASGLISDIGQMPFKESVKQNASKAFRNVLSSVRQAGSGIRRKCIKGNPSKKTKTIIRAKAIKKKPTLKKKAIKARILDIFTNRK